MNKKNWACPFCSLLCDDDLINDLTDNNILNTNFACPKASHGLGKIYNLKNKVFKSIINKVEVDHYAAIQKARSWLSKSNNPVFCGLGVDIAGARSIVKFANKTNAIVDHKFGETLSKVNRSLQTKGLFFTTLSEVKSRADAVVFIGKDSFNKKSCFYKKIDQNIHKKNKKKIVNYGDLFDSTDNLIDSLQNLSALQKQNNFFFSSKYNDNFLKNLSSFSYIVFVWDPACYPDDADAIADVLLEIVRNLNKKTRGGILTLAGDEGSITMQTVMTWMTGLPLRTAFTSRGLRYEPNKYSIKKIIQQNVSDIVIWISCFSSELPDYLLNLNCPLIILGHYEISDQVIQNNLDNFIFIPVAIPGVDVEGHLVRCDGVVTVPLEKIVDSDLPSVQKVIYKIMQNL